MISKKVSDTNPSGPYIASFWSSFHSLPSLHWRSHWFRLSLNAPLSFAIAQRTSELGIRMALGAQRSHILWIVLRTTLTAVGGGIIVGLILNLFMERILRHWMPDSVSSPSMLALVTLLFLVCATITCFPPARRASNVDPRQTLRCRMKAELSVLCERAALTW